MLLLVCSQIRMKQRDDVLIKPLWRQDIVMFIHLNSFSWNAKKFFS